MRRLQRSVRAPERGMAGWCESDTRPSSSVAAAAKADKVWVCGSRRMGIRPAASACQISIRASGTGCLSPSSTNPSMVDLLTDRRRVARALTWSKSCSCGNRSVRAPRSRTADEIGAAFPGQRIMEKRPDRLRRRLPEQRALLSTAPQGSWSCSTGVAAGPRSTMSK